MIALGQTYAWKFLERCDAADLERYMCATAASFSGAMGDEYTLAPTNPQDQEMLLRWSRGYLLGSQEMSLRFPRFHYGFVSADKKKSWIAVVHFTRIPHIRFVYSNRREKHALPALLQRELGQQLIESETVDLFIRNSDRIFAGNTVGLYVYEKLQHLAGLRKLAEDSKYTPEGSDLKALLQNLSSIFSEERRTPKPVELPFRGSAVRNFLEKSDSRVAASLGGDKLEVLLQRVGISAKQWLTAGRRGLLDRLGGWRRGSEPSKTE